MTRTIDYGNLMHEAMRSLIRHVDPSVEFGLRFETQESDDDEDDDEIDVTDEADEDTGPNDDGGKKDADVVSLDSFRK
ncbi:MAG: ClpXP protease specificity-enhancing factor SspB [Maritimibacter sp.]